MYKCAKLYLKRVIIVQVIQKSGVTSVGIQCIVAQYSAFLKQNLMNNNKPIMVPIDSNTLNK